ncbi:MFS transporter [Photobacterium atrarenae]|uniref:MFS transporter n=1 Tax=Photobacterium atrarenae TaxID=865757 RepID=A0ABY5GDL1_9GAMM|nr:MFS transporter [Photobacterium atrarenae]UTV27194.1 MFS transporter [Photobacterium atrarenae]
MEDYTRAKRPVLLLALLISMVSIGTLMMVMPLGVDFVADLGMKTENIGYISGGAMFASALVGFFLAPYVDRYDRKYAIITFLTLRSVFIFVCGLATTQNELLFWFILTGCFSGPMVGLTMASVIDVTDIKERGKAMAFVSSGFSLAAILIVPLSLQISQWLSWQNTFFFFSLLGLALSLACWLLMPNMRAHLKAAKAPGQGTSLMTMLSSAPFVMAMLLVAVSMFGHFLLVPNLAAYFQFNLSFPREQIGVLYLLGGLASIVAMQLCGRLLDRGWVTQTICVASLLVAVVVYFGFVSPGTWPVYLIFIVFMAASSARTASVSAVTSRVPRPEHRAAFMSYQGTMTNVAAGVASVVASLYLTTGEAAQLEGIREMGVVTILCTLAIPVCMLLLLRSLNKQQASQAPVSA